MVLLYLTITLVLKWKVYIVDPKLEQGISTNLGDLLALVPAERREEAELKAGVVLELIGEVDKSGLTHPVTGLPNLRALAERYKVDKVLNASESTDVKAERREIVTPSVLGWWVEYIDLDNFKTINDTWNHAQGDRVLRYAAQAILRSVRPSIDEVYHPHGDEFVIFAPMFKVPKRGFSLRDLLDQRMRSEIANFKTVDGRKLLPAGMRLTQRDRKSLEIIDWTIGEEYIEGPSIERRRAEQKADAKMQALKRYSREPKVATS